MQPQPYLDVRLASVYHQANAMPASSLRNWADLIVSFSRAESPAVLDLRTGTGMLAVALARRRPGTQAAAVDPSPAMLAQAATLARGSPGPLPGRQCGSGISLSSTSSPHPTSLPG